MVPLRRGRLIPPGEAPKFKPKKPSAINLNRATATSVNFQDVLSGC